MFERIVVGVDGSEGGLEALKLAIGLQKIHDSELFLLSVYLEHTMWEASVSYVNTELTGSTHSALQEYAREVARQCKEFAQAQGVEKVRSFYMGGGPARTIVKFCEDHDAQLIVLGSRGISASERYMLGSVSHKVTNTSTRPVLIV